MAADRLGRGDALGRYVVLEEIGAGGMGVVYAAYDPELDRKVALKVLKTEASVATGPTQESEPRLRLLREAQALARVVHPNVVAVHDVGSLGAQVFLAMEFVAGSELGAISNQRAADGESDWRHILELYLDAGWGLAAVHAAGLAHRDFKPSNVRVGEDGRVRVLDFGLALGLTEPTASSEGEGEDGGRTAQERLPQEASLLEVSLTQPGRVFGTPRYMAPEQHQGRRADERSDQFSFCVALWEAFFGQHPFPARSSQELLEKVKSGVAEPETPPGRELARLRPILARGMALDPGDRYPSLDELLADLELAARPPQRTWLWAALAFGGLLAFGLYWQLARPTPCLDAAQRLEGVWDGERKARMAAAFTADGGGSSSLEGGGASGSGADARWQATSRVLDDYAEAWKEMYVEACEATQVREVQSPELLDLRMDCLEERRWELRSLVDLFLEPTPELISTAATAASRLRSLAPCADAERLLLPLRPPHDDPVAMAALDDVRQSLAKIRAMIAAGLREEALEAALGSVERARQSDHPPIIAEALWVVGSLRQRLVDPEATNEAYLGALESADQGRHDDIRARTLVGLVWTARRQGEAEQATRWLRQARATIRRLDDEPDLLMRWHQAAAQVALLKFEAAEALEHAEKAVELSVTVRGPEHLDTAIYLSTLSAAYSSGARYREALEASRRSAEIQRQALGKDHPDLGHIEHNVAIQELMLGLVDPARDRLRRSAELGQTRRDDHMIRVYSNLAGAAARLGREDEALESLERARELTADLHGTESRRMSVVLNYYGDVFLELGRPRDAIEPLETALELLRGREGVRPRTRLPALLNLALARTRLGQTSAARESLSKATAVLSEGDLWIWVVRRIEGLLAAKEGRSEHAVTQLTRAVELLREDSSASQLDLASVELELAQALQQDGQDDRALEMAIASRRRFADLGSSGQRGQVEVEAWIATFEAQRPG